MPSKTFLPSNLRCKSMILSLTFGVSSVDSKREGSMPIGNASTAIERREA